MKRLFLILTALICFLGVSFAQKKVISQARTYVKSGKELAKAEKMMTDLLKDSANRTNEKVWLTLFDAVKKQYEQGNEKLYLKQKYDTASLFTTARKMFTILESFDSLDARPNKKGVVELKYRDKHADFLNTYRPNLYNAGSYHLRKMNFQEAYTYFDTYIDCAGQPLFEKYKYADNDTLLASAAFYALYSGYRLKDAQKVFKYQTLAEGDSARRDNIIQYLAETHLMQKDTAAYVHELLRGFDEHPSHPFFFPRLIDYYNSMGETDTAMVFIDRALATDSASQLYLFAKSSALLNTGRYEECINVTQKLLTLNDSLPEANCNMGLAYYNKGLQLDKTPQRGRKRRNAANEMYEKARPYMEKYRQMAPEQRAKWLPALYTIYLNLNMGKEFEEIDRLRGQ